MREILFRGQTRKKGEKVWMDGSPVDGNWVYGGVNQGKGDFSIIYQTEPEIHKYPVYTDTLGQYTGLHDKNGTKIFEGDLVRFVHPDTGEFSEEVQEVVWDDKYVGFCLLLRATGYKESFDGVPHWYVVIGNIHDNPELVST